MKLKKGDVVAKVINIMGYRTVTFGWKILKDSPVIRIKEPNDYETCLGYDSRGNEINGMNCSYLLPINTALDRVESGDISLAGGEEESYLNFALQRELDRKS